MYKIISKSESCYRVYFDSSHAIYGAHFPGNPITPGVYLMSIAGDLLSDFLGRRVDFVGAKSVKFLSVLNPQTTPEADFRLSVNSHQDLVEVQAVVEAGGGVVAKMTMIYK